MMSLPMVLVSTLLATARAAILDKQCSCGFQDPTSKEVYTDALIVYFNETEVINDDLFLLQDFEHKKEQGWNSVWKVGAKPGNVEINNDTFIWPHIQSLQLRTSPSTPDHVVNGGSLRSVRQDMQYGSFRAGMRGAAKYTGGTALSFMLRYNGSEALNVDLMNMMDWRDARVSYLINGEWPSEDSVTNYTVMEAAGQDPWRDYTDVRFDWNTSTAAFWIAGNQTRAVTRHDRTLPLAGQPLYLRTWSTGDDYYMEGPPGVNGTRGHVLYVRSFFNSSAMTDEQHRQLDQRCVEVSRCSMDDTSLRGSTSYGPASLVRWKFDLHRGTIRDNAGIVAACCSSFGIFALINVFFRRTPWHALRSLFLGERTSQGKREKTKDVDSDNGHKTSTADYSGNTTPRTPTPAPTTGAQTPRSGYQTPLPAYGTPPPWSFPNGQGYNMSMASLPRVPSPLQSSQGNREKEPARGSENVRAGEIDKIEQSRKESRNAAEGCSPFRDGDVTKDLVEPATQAPLTATEKGKEVAVTVAPTESKEEPATAIPDSQARPPPTKRIDYLAGLVAVACLGVTLHHFCQTFWPWITLGYGPSAHYPEAEKWFKIFLGSYLLTQLWIGPFFLTATRFLSTNYLKNGKLDDIAKKELRRAPRLFVPIVIVSLLEYFLISMGLTASLEWLPSVSWSTWPYVSAQDNFGVFMNNMIELGYLMPNAIPEVVTHYCIGVLWTVPVQLQFTYVVLTAAVLIRDIRNPWKRFGFYTIAILSGWYARSWSACHWCGLVLSDLEATFKWRQYLQKRPVALYAVISGAFIFAATAPLVAIFNQEWSFPTAENSIHPDFATGRPIMQVGAVYPDYNEPTLTILVFSIGLQILVELSTWFQKFLSLKVILWLHPHIMTIYLTHGFVMWTWGAWCALALNDANVPYWANLLITLITTYALLFLLATVLTPLMEFPTQALMRNIDRWTKDEPVPRRPTVAPFKKDLVENRQGSTAHIGES
ncbi:hypothetical protein KC330_g6247 [Hortaea werneckii]|nr:hypothetical protein KC330_g6247 [Hortaea werneckii]